LSALAVRSKAHWGYDAAFLDAVRHDLEITPAQIGEWLVCVLEEAGVVRGFYALRPAERDTVELERLFVDPTVLGCGYGRQLFEHAVMTARDDGFALMEIASDPFAEEFYLRLGAVRVGEAPAPIAGRSLPLLRYQLGSRR
jgi:GNAT superfamily N-acetyltransferase